MNGFTKLLLLAGAGLGIYYLPTIITLKTLKISLYSVLPVGIFETKINTIMGVKITNVGFVDIQLQWIKADIIINGLKISEFEQSENLIIPVKLEQKFNVHFTVDAEEIGTEIFKQLIASNLQNTVIQVRGSLMANNKTLPVDTYFTIKDFTT
jgi:LEA14-like dessication related protein